MYKVYEHVAPNGHRYVGITKTTLEKRFGHKGIQYKHSSVKFWNAIQKHGWDNMLHNLLYDNLTFEEACQIEKQEIKHDKELGISYNITDGGDGRCGVTLSPESRAKISASKRGKKTSRDYSYFPDEWKHKISSTLTGYKHSDETRLKCRIHASGRKWVHLNNKRRFVKEPEYLQLINEGWVPGTGIQTKHNDSARQKMRLANAGKIVSNETRAKISITLKQQPKKCRMTNGDVEICVPITDQDKYKKCGFYLGRKRKINAI